MINLKTLKLDRYNVNYESVINEFNNDSKSIFIHDISRRLISSSTLNENILREAYVVLDNNIPIGYVYISGNTNDEVYVEISILKEKRKQGYGKKILTEISDYLFEKNMRVIKVNIEPSNIGSINMVDSCDFILDEDDYENNHYTGKMTFYKENEYYVDKRRK